MRPVPSNPAEILQPLELVLVLGLFPAQELEACNAIQSRMDLAGQVKIEPA